MEIYAKTFIEMLQKCTEIAVKKPTACLERYLLVIIAFFLNSLCAFFYGCNVVAWFIVCVFEIHRRLSEGCPALGVDQPFFPTYVGMRMTICRASFVVCCQMFEHIVHDHNFSKKIGHALTGSTQPIFCVYFYFFFDDSFFKNRHGLLILQKVAKN